ncbi:hypothetical protein ACJIZ3_007698 [Penstemon smallii]|uniref:Uncharacterized protein n=1 Tax=Penstemon smallii TaxID=265156 RepID=A0ABD3T810_9LAMI
MARFSTYYCLIVILTTMYSVELMVRADSCYKVLADLGCNSTDIYSKCLPSCTKLCGPEISAVCVSPYANQTAVCACQFEAPDCTKPSVC